MDGKGSKDSNKVLEVYLRHYHSRALSNVFLARQLARHRSLAALVSAAQSEIESSTPKNSETLSLLQSLVHPSNDAVVQKAICEDLLWLDGSSLSIYESLGSGIPRSILCFEDEEYPARLREIAVPPPVLYVLGNLSVLANAQVAIVGSRKASAYGLKNATWMAKELSAKGITVCSGLALGIDSAAHKGAIDQVGTTVAVVATGLDRVYPRRNMDLHLQIVRQGGAIVSEFPLGATPRPEYFPQRNRIISGMSLGTLVVEAQLKSGSLITARTALEQNREVFTIPGSIHTTGMRGCHWLIKQGALLVESPADVLDALAAQIANINPEFELESEQSQQSCSSIHRNQEITGSVEGGMILRLLRENDYTLDGLLDATNLPFADLVTNLARLESMARIELVAGRYREI